MSSADPRAATLLDQRDTLRENLRALIAFMEAQGFTDALYVLRNAREALDAVDADA